MTHILYNPLSNCAKNIEETIQSAKDYYKDEQGATAENLMEITDLKAYFDSMVPQDKVVLLGGDGTINVLCNKLRGYEIKNKIYLYKAGTGNDFLRDVCGDGMSVELNEYIDNLPVVTVNDKEFLFINNVGYGIDGMVCAVGEEMRSQGKKEINYTTVAIKLLLTKYKNHKAVVTVDGERHEFKRVWMAPVMNGRYYGGGMMPCPAQDRKGDKLSLCVIHDTNAIQTLLIFPSIFKGEHIKHTSKVTVLSGKNIEVEFDKPRDVQIDGEVISGITKISVAKYGSITERDKELASATV